MLLSRSRTLLGFECTIIWLTQFGMIEVKRSVVSMYFYKVYNMN